MSKFTKTWRVPGAPTSHRREGMKDWAKKEIAWTCKLGKNVQDDDKCINWLKEKKLIKASKVKGAEGWLYDFGNHWVRYWKGEHWHSRNVQEGDFMVVFTDEAFALLSDSQCQVLVEKINIRHLDEKAKTVANPFGISQVDIRKAKEVK